MILSAQVHLNGKKKKTRNICGFSLQHRRVCSLLFHTRAREWRRLTGGIIPRARQADISTLPPSLWGPRETVWHVAFDWMMEGLIRTDFSPHRRKTSLSGTDSQIRPLPWRRGGWKWEHFVFFFFPRILVSHSSAEISLMILHDNLLTSSICLSCYALKKSYVYFILKRAGRQTLAHILNETWKGRYERNSTPALSVGRRLHRSKIQVNKKIHKLHINGTDHGTYDVMSSDSDLDWQQTSSPTGLIDVKMGFQSVEGVWITCWSCCSLLRPWVRPAEILLASLNTLFLWADWDKRATGWAVIAAQTWSRLCNSVLSLTETLIGQP